MALVSFYNHLLKTPNIFNVTKNTKAKEVKNCNGLSIISLNILDEALNKIMQHYVSMIRGIYDFFNEEPCIREDVCFNFDKTDRSFGKFLTMFTPETFLVEPTLEEGLY